MDGNYATHEYDVVVIGAGGAGLRAAIEASSSGASVAIISKSMLGKAHTVMAEGGAAAAGAAAPFRKAHAALRGESPNTGDSPRGLQHLAIGHRFSST